MDYFSWFILGFWMGVVVCMLLGLGCDIHERLQAVKLRDDDRMRHDVNLLALWEKYPTQFAMASTDEPATPETTWPRPACIPDAAIGPDK